MRAAIARTCRWRAQCTWIPALFAAVRAASAGSVSVHDPKVQPAAVVCMLASCRVVYERERS